MMARRLLFTLWRFFLVESSSSSASSMALMHKEPRFQDGFGGRNFVAAEEVDAAVVDVVAAADVLPAKGLQVTSS